MKNSINRKPLQKATCIWVKVSERLWLEVTDVFVIGHVEWLHHVPVGYECTMSALLLPGASPTNLL